MSHFSVIAQVKMCMGGNWGVWVMWRLLCLLWMVDWLQGADRPWPDRQWALCIFDDLLEHTGPVCYTAFRSLTDDTRTHDDEIRRSTAHSMRDEVLNPPWTLVWVQQVTITYSILLLVLWQRMRLESGWVMHQPSSVFAVPNVTVCSSGPYCPLCSKACDPVKQVFVVGILTIYRFVSSDKQHCGQFILNCVIIACSTVLCCYLCLHYIILHYAEQCMVLWLIFSIGKKILGRLFYFIVSLSWTLLTLYWILIV